MRFMIGCLVWVLFGWPGSASAETAATGQSERPSWDTRFDTAYQTLARGEFEAASTAFKALLVDAPEGAKKTRVETLLALSKEWATKGFTLVLGSEATEALNARGNRRRTKGEIAGLYVDSVVYGLGSGLWVSVLAETNGAAGVILPSLALAGGSAGLLYYLDQDPLGYGVARSASAGLRLGLYSGISWVTWNQSRNTGGLQPKANASLIWALSTAGMVGGGLLGQELGATPGAASMVESGGLWTSFTSGLLTYGILGDTIESDTFFLASAIGLNLGALGAGFLAADSAPSTARVRYLDLGAISGGALFGGLYLAFADIAEQGGMQCASLVTGTGIASGLSLAWILTADMPKDAFVERSTVAWTPPSYPPNTASPSVLWAPQHSPFSIPENRFHRSRFDT